MVFSLLYHRTRPPFASTPTRKDSESLPLPSEEMEDGETEDDVEHFMENFAKETSFFFF